MIRIKWAWLHGIFSHSLTHFCYLAVCIAYRNQIEEKKKLSHCTCECTSATNVFVCICNEIVQSSNYHHKMPMGKFDCMCIWFFFCFFACTRKTKRERKNEQKKQTTPSCTYFAYCFHLFVDNDHYND